MIQLTPGKRLVPLGLDTVLDTSSRYRALVLWPYTIDGILNPRLDTRVDQMVKVWYHIRCQYLG